MPVLYARHQDEPEPNLRRTNGNGSRLESATEAQIPEHHAINEKQISRAYN
jgi:hypothetical protein